MAKVDAYEQEVLSAFEKGRLKSVATKAELMKLKAAARATAVKDPRANIRLSSIDLSDIQVKALQEGVPYQTLIASVLHKYVSGSVIERSTFAISRPAPRRKRANRSRPTPLASSMRTRRTRTSAASWCGSRTPRRR